MYKYEYKILNFWNDADDLYVEYIVTDIDSNIKAHCVEYYNVSDLECDYINSTEKEIITDLLNLVSNNNGREFNLPKVSELSPLLVYIYDFVSQSDNSKCDIDNDFWNYLREEENFSNKDYKKLEKEIKKFNLDDYIVLNENELKLSAFGGLQCCFNDDRLEILKKEAEYER